MRAFARACLEVTDVGRLALAVLDGGVFASRRTLELAKLVRDAAALMSAEHNPADGAAAKAHGGFRDLAPALRPSATPLSAPARVPPCPTAP